MNIEEIYQHFLRSRGVSLDTRTMKRGALFIAIVGTQFDGHDFVGEAIDKGAVFVVVDTDKKILNKHEGKVIRVKNTTETLKQLARYHRMQFKIPVVVVGGSNGKTTTKNLIASVLSQKYNVLQSIKSYNNEIGVSLTLLNINKKHEILVLEIGTNHPGEIAVLLEISRPTHGLITSIGKEHLEGFKDLRGVKKEEGTIFKYLSQNDGVGFIGESLPSDIKRLYTKRAIFYGTKDVKVKSVFPLIFSYKYKNKNYEFVTSLVGIWNLENILAAVVVGRCFEVPFPKIASAIKNHQPENLRGQIISFKKHKVLLDCYNSNPSSAVEVLKMLKLPQFKTLYLVIGGMLELGTRSKVEHKKLLSSIFSLKPVKAVFIGVEFDFLSERILKKGYSFFRNTMDAKSFLDTTVFQKSSLIVVKGSRAYGLEQLFKK